MIRPRHGFAKLLVLSMLFAICYVILVVGLGYPLRDYIGQVVLLLAAIGAQQLIEGSP